MKNEIGYERILFGTECDDKVYIHFSQWYNANILKGWFKIELGATKGVIKYSSHGVFLTDCNARIHETLPTLWNMFTEFGSPLSVSPLLCGKKQPQGFCVLHGWSNDGQCVIRESSSVMWVESTNCERHECLQGLNS